MTGFVPPKPVPPKKKLNPVRRFFLSLHSSLDTFYEKSYGMKMGDVRLPGRTVYFVNQPELVQRVLVTEAARYPKSRVMSTILKLLLGEGVFVSNGALWERQRRMMDPAFKSARIKAIFPLMREAADAMAERFASGAAGPDTMIDIEMTHVTADVIFRTLYSRPFTREQAELIFENFEKFQRYALLQGVLDMAGLPRWLTPGKARARRHGEAIREQLHIPIR
ncbi:MAG: cytochrome P450, partial [Sphingomonadales bacterium]|nr:cytochrome P450 [Sphingomonadales bacterium]